MVEPDEVHRATLVASVEILEYDSPEPGKIFRLPFNAPKAIDAVLENHTRLVIEGMLMIGCQFPGGMAVA